MSNDKYNDYISWDEYFMSIAQLSARRSKDPHTRVGSCIVSKDNRILSTGYNGAPNGYDDDKFPWKNKGEKLETKYMFVVHSELNAILNYRGSNRELEGARIYVHFFPCNECAKAIIQSGIKEVIYLHPYEHFDHSIESEATRRMFDECGIKYRQFKPDKNERIELELIPKCQS